MVIESILLERKSILAEGTICLHSRMVVQKECRRSCQRDFKGAADMQKSRLDILLLNPVSYDFGNPMSILYKGILKEIYDVY